MLHIRPSFWKTSYNPAEKTLRFSLVSKATVVPCHQKVASASATIGHNILVGHPCHQKITSAIHLDLDQIVQINSDKATNTHASKPISKFHEWMDAQGHAKRGSIHPAPVDAVATGSLGFINEQTEKGLQGADGKDDRTGFLATTSRTRQVSQISWAGREWMPKGEGNGEGNSLNRDSPPATGRSELGVRENPSEAHTPCVPCVCWLV
jgi:hypothetical protein